MSKPLKVKKVSTDDPIYGTATKILRTRLKEFYSHWPDPHLMPSYEQLHNLRISGKRLRYSAEQLRELYPDRLTFLIDLLKRGQDSLGQIQDCVTHGKVIEEELERLKSRNPAGPDIFTLKKLLDSYDQRKSMLFDQYREIWMGMAMKEFRKALKVMVSTISPTQPVPDHFDSKEQKAFQSDLVTE